MTKTNIDGQIRVSAKFIKVRYRLGIWNPGGLTIHSCYPPPRQRTRILVLGRDTAVRLESGASIDQC